MRTFGILLLAFVCIHGVGCKTMMPKKLFSYQSEELPPPDPWIEETGKISRQEFTPEEVHDPLNIRKYFVSDTAQSIERNLGVGN